MMFQDLAASTLCLQSAIKLIQAIENTQKRSDKIKSSFAHHIFFYTEFTGSNKTLREAINWRFLWVFFLFSIFTPSNAKSHQRQSSRAKSVSTCVSTPIQNHQHCSFTTDFSKGVHHALV